MGVCESGVPHAPSTGVPLRAMLPGAGVVHGVRRMICLPSKLSADEELGMFFTMSCSSGEAADVLRDKLKRKEWTAVRQLLESMDLQ